MKRLLWLTAMAAGAVGCGFLSPAKRTASSGPSLSELARSLSAPPGYVQTKGPALYRRDSLYLAIDGMDGEYMSYGCVGLALVEWPKRADAQEKIQAEISDMGSPLGAFGIYSRAHTGKGEFADVGEEAAVAEDAVEFARGRFYVRLMGPPDARAELEKLARAMVAEVPPGPKPDQLLPVLPSEGRVPRSERWIPSAAFGMDFMRDVAAARYQVGDTTVDLQVAALPDAAAARAALDKFRDAVKGRSPQPIEGNPSAFAYTDEWLGRVAVFQIGRRVAVIVGYQKKAAIEGLLGKIAAS